MSRRLGIFLLLMLTASAGYAAECVVVLHGLARSNASMQKMYEALLAEGFSAVNVD